MIGKYELGIALAAGDFDCRTRLCSHVVTGASYVVRIYDKAVLEEAQWMWERVRASIYVQRTLPKHENIVEMVECFETASSLYILMQLFQSVNVTKLLCSNIRDTGEAVEAEDGSVPPSVLGAYWNQTLAKATQIRQRGSPLLNTSVSAFEDSQRSTTTSGSTTPRRLLRKRNKFSKQQICNFFSQVVRGVLHMHEHNVVHLGIAPDHILINDRGLVKIGNLVSCCFCTPGTLMEEMKGTRHSVAPEVLSSDPYDPYLVDAWSLGVLLYFMLNGRYPHDGANTLEHIMYNHIRPSDPHIPHLAKDLLSRLLVTEPAKRMRVSEILQHPFFSDSERSVSEENLLTVENEPRARVFRRGFSSRSKEVTAAITIQRAYRKHRGTTKQLARVIEPEPRDRSITRSTSSKLNHFHSSIVSDADVSGTVSGSSHGDVIVKPFPNYRVAADATCPVCQRPPKPERNINATPYLSTRYVYAGEGKFADRVENQVDVASPSEPAAPTPLLPPILPMKSKSPDVLLE